MGKIHKIVFKIGFMALISTIFAYNVYAMMAEVDIQPGQGVGVLMLGDNINEVFRKIGERKADTAQKIEDRNEVWLSYKDMGMILIFDKNMTLIKIMVTSKSLIVGESEIRIGSSVSDVKRFYGEKATIDERNGLLEYPEKGISFTILKDENNVHAITIMEREIR